MNTILEAYRKLNILYEAKADQEAFVNKFGKDYFDLFNKFKGKLKSKSISTDMTWHVKHTSVENMKEILDNFNNQIVTDDKGKSKLNRKKIFEDDKFVVWEILDWETAMNMADGASWCIAGRYQTSEPKPSQAEHYFNEYLKTIYSNYYYVISKSNDRKWCICKRPNHSVFGGKDTIDIWSQEDKAIATRSEGSGIQDLPTIEEIGYYVDDYKSFKNIDKEIDDPYLELAMEFLCSNAVVYDEDNGYYADETTGACCMVEEVSSAKDSWVDYNEDFGWDRGSIEGTFENTSYMDDDAIKDDVEGFINNEISTYDYDELLEICTIDNYDALDRLNVCDAIRQGIIEYIWPDEETQEWIRNESSTDLEADLDEAIKIETMKICQDVAKARSWLQVACEVIDKDYVENVILENMTNYIDLNTYWEDNIYDCLCTMYGEDVMMSNDGQLFAYSY